MSVNNFQLKDGAEAEARAEIFIQLGTVRFQLQLSLASCGSATQGLPIYRLKIWCPHQFDASLASQAVKEALLQVQETLERPTDLSFRPRGLLKKVTRINKRVWNLVVIADRFSLLKRI